NAQCQRQSHTATFSGMSTDQHSNSYIFASCDGVTDLKLPKPNNRKYLFDDLSRR
ncbi:Hypothetical predicted protein, partial [Podarcis lilfordi]